MLLELLTVIAPVFICVALGYGWVRQGNPFPGHFISNMNMNVSVPCMVFAGLFKLDGQWAEMGTVIMASVLAIAIMFVASLLLALAFGRLSRCYLIALSSTNCGNMGLSLCLFAFGDAGLAVGITYFAVSTFLFFPLASLIAEGNFQLSKLFKIPIIYATLFAGGFMAMGVEPPRWLANTTTLIGGIAIPTMLLALGSSLAQIEAGQSLRLFMLSLSRMLLGTAVGLAVTSLFGLTGLTKGVIILQCSMPIAVFTYLLADRYHRQPRDVATMVMMTTLISIGSIPLVLAFVLGMEG